MKISQLCRACHRRLQAVPAPAQPATRRLRLTNPRPFINEQPSLAEAVPLFFYTHSRGYGTSTSTAQHHERVQDLEVEPEAPPSTTGRQDTGPKKPQEDTKESGPKFRRQPKSRKESIPRTKKERPISPDIRSKKNQAMRFLQLHRIQHEPVYEEEDKAKENFHFWNRNLGKVRRYPEVRNTEWINCAEWLYTKGSVEEIRKAWEGLDEEMRWRDWPQIMLSTLSKKREASFRVLSGTMNPLPPGYAIADIVYDIVRDLPPPKARRTPERRQEAGQIFQFIHLLLTELPASYLTLHQRTVGLLAQRATGNQAWHIYQTLQTSGYELHHNTALHFARTLAGGVKNVAHKEKALKLLKDLAKNGLDLNTPQASSVITALLHCQPAGDDSSQCFSPTHALQSLMEDGLVPNIVVFTAYLDTLCQRNELDEAINLFKLLVENGVELDRKAFSTLFRGAKHSLDASRVAQVLALADKARIPRKQSVKHGIHALFYFAGVDIRDNMRRPSGQMRPFLPMLHIYSTTFETGPLQSLIPESLPALLMRSKPSQGHSRDIEHDSYVSNDHYSLHDNPTLDQPPVHDEAYSAHVSHDRSSPSAGDNSPWDFERTLLPVLEHFTQGASQQMVTPDSTTLATMLRAYIRSLQDPHDITALWSSFKSQLEDQNARQNWARALVDTEGSLLHDAFIHVMFSGSDLRKQAMGVFGDMLKSNLGQDVSSPAHPAPSVFTYGILLGGLWRQREHELVRQVVDVMTEQGIDPNIVIWNIMIKGYAYSQNADRTVEALQLMDAAGLKPNDNTIKAFGRLQDQDGALAKMEDVIHRNKQTMEDHKALEDWDLQPAATSDYHV